MSTNIRFSVMAIAYMTLGAGLGGCSTDATSPYYPASFSASLPGEARPFPDACLAITDDNGSSPVLPPGCANVLNLQRMVEKPGDLRQGRNTGPTFAAPVAGAAERYLRGEYEDERDRRRRLEQQSSTSGSL